MLFRSGEITGNSVPQKDGSLLFTRKGAMDVTHILAEYPIEKGDKVDAKDGDRVLKDTVIIKRKSGDVVVSESGRLLIKKDKVYLTSNPQKYEITNGSTLTAKEGDIVPADQVIGSFDPFSEPIIAEVDGYVHYEDIVIGSTLEEHVDTHTGKVERRISNLHLDVKQSRVLITDEAGNELGSYYLPAGAILLVDDKKKIAAGETIAKMAKEAAKTNDITGGLPRVSELFEARKPKIPAVLAQISGTVKFKGITKAKRVVVVEDEYGKAFEHQVPMIRRMLVRDGDHVRAGEQLCDGAPSPHDILAILGENALQEYLMKEIGRASCRERV